MDAPAELLRLDPQIRNWVLLPIIALSLLMGLVRHYLNLTMTASANSSVDVKRAKNQHVSVESVGVAFLFRLCASRSSLSALPLAAASLTPASLRRTTLADHRPRAPHVPERRVHPARCV